MKISHFDPTTYRAAVGSLLYLAINTRPDILFAINQASRHSQKPTTQDWQNVVNVFNYLKGNPHYEIYFSGKSNYVSYVDSDFGGDLQTRKSTSVKICDLNLFWNHFKSFTNKTLHFNKNNINKISASCYAW